MDKFKLPHTPKTMIAGKVRPIAQGKMSILMDMYDKELVWEIISFVGINYTGFSNRVFKEKIKEDYENS